jgi:hypothetical protein
MIRVLQLTSVTHISTSTDLNNETFCIRRRHESERLLSSVIVDEINVTTLSHFNAISVLTLVRNVFLGNEWREQLFQVLFN